MEFGINLSFTLKRWPEPEAWAAIVRDDLGLGMVQFTLDLLDPWWPEPQRRALATGVRRAAEQQGITIHSAQLGLAWYTFNGLLHPDPDGRAVGREWWKRAMATAAELGTTAVGGPLGAMSAKDAADPETVERRYRQLLEEVVLASEIAKQEGLTALLVEPTPLPREVPHTVDQSLRLVRDLADRTEVPIRYVIDVGHALYRPLYGETVALAEWLEPLRDQIGVLHIQNHDYRSDAHLGWPDDRGSYDVAAFAATVREAGLDHVPVVLELFFPFEASDEDVLARTRSSVRHCLRELA